MEVIQPTNPKEGQEDPFFYEGTVVTLVSGNATAKITVGGQCTIVDNDGDIISRGYGKWRGKLPQPETDEQLRRMMQRPFRDDGDRPYRYEMNSWFEIHGIYIEIHGIYKTRLAVYPDNCFYQLSEAIAEAKNVLQRVRLEHGDGPDEDIS
jgi:hypothetical protein